jgi:hypothetical protein
LRTQADPLAGSPPRSVPRFDGARHPTYKEGRPDDEGKKNQILKLD